MGIVSEIVDLATCPVLAVRGGEVAWPPSRIVVGEDSSVGVREAAHLAASMESNLRVEVILGDPCKGPPGGPTDARGVGIVILCIIRSSQSREPGQASPAPWYSQQPAIAYPIGSPPLLDYS